MANATAEGQVFDVLSVLDNQDQPRLNNCTLQIGEVALEFKNGRAKVPEAFAPEVARHPLVTIPGYTGPVAPPVPNASAELPDFDREQQLSPAEREARVRAAAEYLKEQGLEVGTIPGAAPEPQEDPRVKPLEDRIAELEELVKQATTLDPKSGKPVTEDKADAGEKEPAAAAEGGAKIPDGFAAETSDGKPRCMARKGSGEQCKNAAVDGGPACGLPAHQKLLAN